jgi:hypothetical protein
MKVLIVEDETKKANFLRRDFSEAGFLSIGGAAMAGRNAPMRPAPSISSSSTSCCREWTGFHIHHGSRETRRKTMSTARAEHTEVADITEAYRVSANLGQ